MKKSECILVLVDGGMSILEAEKNVMTKEQFIREIQSEEKMKEVMQNRKIEKARYEYSKCFHCPEEAIPNFTDEEALEYLDEIRNDKYD